MHQRRMLRVAVLAHLRHPIRMPFAGGIEAHTWHLVRALVARGHRVTLFASGDSVTDARLCPIVDEHYDRGLPWSRHHGSDVLHKHLDAAYGRAWDAIESGDFDVVHNNTLHPLPIARARARGVPMLTALHVPPFARLAEVVRGPEVPHLQFSVTSRRQATVWRGDTPVDEGDTKGVTFDAVANGIDLDAWPFQATGDGSAVWAGRITPNKGTHLAMKAARRAGVALSIIGAIEDQEYFTQQVEPLLSDSIRHVGLVSPDRLATLFGQASVLLFTPQWEEPFGLVAIEAMACGLPVAYIDRGAVREVVAEAGVGTRSTDTDALATALDAARAIPREVARRRVEQHFTMDAMLQGYERLYRNCMFGARSGCTAYASSA